ncbi:MAG: PH domain-containing protein [Elusimicrobiota bacterium]
MHASGPHAIVYLRPAAIALTTMAAAALAVRVMPLWVGLLAVAVAAIALIPDVLTRYCASYDITNKRVIIKVGWLWQRTLETTLNRVGAISVEQGLLGRVLGYGDVFLMLPGVGKELLPRIRAPHEFRKRLIEQILCWDREPSPRPYAVGRPRRRRVPLAVGDYAC